MSFWRCLLGRSFSLGKGLGGPLHPAISCKWMTGEVRQRKPQLHLAHCMMRRLVSLFHGSNCCTSFLPLSWSLPSYKFQSSEALTESVGFLVHVEALTDREEIPLWQAFVQTQLGQSLRRTPSKPMVCLQILHTPVTDDHTGLLNTPPYDMISRTKCKIQDAVWVAQRRGHFTTTMTL